MMPEDQVTSGAAVRAELARILASPHVDAGERHGPTFPPSGSAFIAKLAAIGLDVLKFLGPIVLSVFHELVVARTCLDGPPEPPPPPGVA
jgi:hypothetical protein